MNHLIASCVAAVMLCGCALLTPAPPPARSEGGVLVDQRGMTLYTFDRDVAGSAKSLCNGPCAVNWPPFLAAADAKPGSNFTLVLREDGARQWAYKGRPLYLWSKDTKPGETSGDGLNNVWRVART